MNGQRWQLNHAVINFIDPSARIGEGTIVWHFARVLADVTIGAGCSIGSGAEIGRGSVIAEGSRIGANVFLPSHSSIGAHVFIGPGVICTDDRHPKVPQPGDPLYHAQPPRIENGASIGAGAILLPGVWIGAYARVAAGAVVTDDVPDYMMVVGVPARERARSVAAEAW